MTDIYKVETFKQDDLQQCVQLYNSAREYFKAAGIDQWQGNTNHPGELSIKKDSADNVLFTVKRNNENDVFACFMARVGTDETYVPPLVSGAWLTSGTPYAALHRVAVNNDEKGKGIGKVIIDFVREKAVKDGAVSLRCDTHENNKAMRRMLEKNGFEQCGEMLLPCGSPRIAYELVLKKR